MKKIYFLLIALILINSSQAQNFTWIKGNTSFSFAGVYGTQNVPAASNNPGGRHGAAKWTDAAGNLWLFGGEGYSNNTTLCWMNDLWKFDITTHQWVWIRGSNGPNALGVYGTQGVPAASNEPGAREFAASWTDAAGNFWMFGGDGFGSVAGQTTAFRLGDLWKYNPVTNEWTWMHGYNTTQQYGVYGTLGVSAPSNMPGGRYGTCEWQDPQGNLWMFGGRGLATTFPQGDMNDIWKYTISTNQWTWMGGTSTTNQNGIYGTLLVPSATNLPGSRFFAAGWCDASGNFFMFGGSGYSTVSSGYINDLWKYDPVAGTWTWLSGSNISGATGVYGTQGTSSSANVVGGRYSAATWKDNAGNFWLFGGHGIPAAFVLGDLNDLWKYDPSTNEWTWVKGSNLIDQNGTYGTQGVSAPANIPGSRYYNTSWKGNNNTLWLLGGHGFDATNAVADNMDDLWKYQIPACDIDSITSAPSKTICSGSSVTLTAHSSATAAVLWYTSPSSSTSVSSGTQFSSPTLTAVGGQASVSYYAGVANCPNARVSVSITVNALPTLMASASHTRMCRANSVTLTASGANSYTWNFSPPVLSSTVNVVQFPIGTYTYIVVGTNSNNCSSVTSVTVFFHECVGIVEEIRNDFSHSLFPNPCSGEFTIKFKNDELAHGFSKVNFYIINAIGQTVFKKQIYSEQTFIEPELPKGIYFYEIHFDNKGKANGKLVIE